MVSARDGAAAVVAAARVGVTTGRIGAGRRMTRDDEGGGADVVWMMTTSVEGAVVGGWGDWTIVVLPYYGTVHAHGVIHYHCSHPTYVDQL